MKYPTPRLLWPSAYCDQCGRESRATVLVGEKENWDTRTASVCQECLTEALALFPAFGIEASISTHPVPTGSAK